MSYIPSGIDLELRTNKYDASSRSVIASAGKIDTAMDKVIDSAGEMERALNDINADLSIRASVDDADLRTAKGLHDDINTNTSTTTNVSDSELTTAKGLHEDIDTNTSTVAAVDTSALERAKGLVETLGKPVTITVGLAGAGAGLLGGIAGAAGVQGILEMDTALANLEGRTGRLIPQAEALIIDLYTNAWGDSRQAVADVITEADNLNISNKNLEEAVRAAFNVSDTGIGETEEVLRTMDTMVKNDLAKDFTEAGDLLVVGLQNGADRGKDLLDTFNEYGSTFKELKISGPGAIGLITSGLEAGVDNSDRIADSMREIGIRLGEIGTNEDIANAFTQLDELSSVDLQGLLDAYNAGEISGDDFFAGFFDSLSQAVAQDPVQAQTIAATLVGTIAEDFGVETIAQLTPKWNTAMGTLENRAATASTTINNNLASSLTGLQRTLEQEFSEILTEVVDADALVDKAKIAMQRFSAELQAGTSISEAAAIALEISPESIQQFESIIGNIAITLASAIASILDVLNQPDAAAGLRESIRGAVENQLIFDLKLADDGESVRNSVQRALDMGVEAADVGKLVNQSISEQLASGDIAGAMQTIQAIQEMATVPIVVQGMEFAPGTSREDVQQRLEQRYGHFGQEDRARAINQAFALTDIASMLNFTDIEKQAQAAAAQAQTAFNDALNAGDFNLARQIAEQMGQTELVALVDEYAGSFDEANTDIAVATAGVTESVDAMSTTVGTHTDDIETSAGDMGTNVAGVLDQNVLDWEAWQVSVTEDIDSVNKMIDTVMEKAAGIGVDLSGNGEPPPAAENDKKAGGGSFGSAWRGWVGEEGPEIATFGQAGSIINAASSQQLMTALSSLFSPMGGGGNSTTNIYLNQTNTAQTRAQADGIGWRTARAVRGYA